MRIKIMFEDTEKDVELKPKKKHRNEFMDRLDEMKKIAESKEGNEMKATRDFMEFQDSLVVECSTITQEEFDELDLEEQGKLTKALRGIVFPFAGGDPANFF